MVTTISLNKYVVHEVFICLIKKKKMFTYLLSHYFGINIGDRNYSKLRFILDLSLLA